MNFYYRSLAEGRCEVVCTRCFLTIGAAREMEEILRIESSHVCPAVRIAPIGPARSAPGASRRPLGGVPCTLPPLPLAGDRCAPRFVRNAFLLLVAALVLYVLPTVLEWAALRHWNPWLSVILPGDLAGCACLGIVFRKIKQGISLYCLLTAIEACVYWLHVAPPEALLWFTDFVPSLVVVVMLLRSARPTAKLVVIH